MTEETLFELVIRTPAAERAALLDRACEGNPELRIRMDALLKADAASAPFLEQPLVMEAARLESTQTFTSPELADGAIIAGRYTLEQQLGEGGMGEVWVARQSEPVKRKVAVKLIKPGMDTRSVVQRFEQERQALAMMDHPNIAKVLDGGMTVDRRPYFVMELVNGLPLTKFCDEAKLGITERLELFIAICHAVQHAHQKGIVHRDLKPGNILVTMVDGKPVPKVIDFGVAKATGGKLTDESLSTQFGAVIGTLEYMAPEQAGFSNQDVDTRADIYSLGVILYELLTGLRPFDSKRLKLAAMDEVMRIIREEEPSKPSTKLSTADSLPSLAAVRHIEPKKLTALLRGELDWVVMKCLEKQRDRRYETASSLGRDLQRYLDNETVEARPPSQGYQLKKFISRHRHAFVAAGLVLLALLSGMIGTGWGLLEAMNQERQAREETKAKEQALQREALQRQDAETQKEKALQAAASEKAAREQIKKSRDIITSIFDDLDILKLKKTTEPLEAALAKRLVHAGEQLEHLAAGESLEVAELQNKLGTTLRNLGHPGKAIPLFEKSHRTKSRVLGVDHADTLAVQSNLAVAYQEIGQRQKALLMHEQLLKLTRAKLGAEHPSTLIAIGNLATGYHLVGQEARALSYFEEAYQLMKNKYGLDHPDTLTCMNNLAIAYQNAGQLDRGLQLQEETLQRFKKKLGDDHPFTLSCMNNLALCYTTAHQYPRAIALFEEAYPLVLKKNGSEHPETLTIMCNLALAYRDTGKVDRALPLFEKALELQQLKFGRDHPDALITMGNLAEAYRAGEQFNRAIPLFEDALKRSQAKLGIDHPSTLVIMANLAECYRTAQLLDRALPLYEQTFQLIKAKHGAMHPNTITVMANLGDGYHAAGKLPQAIAHCEEAVKLMKIVFGIHHPNTLAVQRSLAAVYLDDHQPQKAEPLYQSYLAGMRKQPGMKDVEYSNYLARVSLELQMRQQFVLAEPYLRECLSIRQKEMMDHWSTFNTQSMLGTSLLGLKKYSEAEPLLLKGYEGMKQREKTIPPAGKARLTEALNPLIQLYTETNKPGEVKKWQIEKDKLLKLVETKP